MPFLSPDWRGPGEDWVKCEDGWETRKNAMASGQPFRQIGCERVNERRRRYNTEPSIHSAQAEKEEKENFPTMRLERHRSLPTLQPFCPIIIKCTREVAGFNTLSDVLKRLDFRSAAHDVRRFQYVATILRLLLKPDRLFNLPGSCQKLIFRILEEMTITVFAEKRGEPELKKLLQDLHSAVDQRKVWGSNHGSETLNRAHKNARGRLACITALEQKRYKSSRYIGGNPHPDEAALMEEEQLEKDRLTLEELPEECIREILLRLSDSNDLDTAGNVMPKMSLIVKERRLWRELVQTHFNNQQIEFVINKKPELKEGKKFRDLYFALKRQFGLRQEFTELVMLCRSCRVLYWQSLGHPCAGTNDQRCSTGQIPVTPATFLTFFSI